MSRDVVYAPHKHNLSSRDLHNIRYQELFSYQTLSMNISSHYVSLKKRVKTWRVCNPVSKLRLTLLVSKGWYKKLNNVIPGQDNESEIGWIELHHNQHLCMWCCDLWCCSPVVRRLLAEMKFRKSNRESDWNEAMIGGKRKQGRKVFASVSPSVGRWDGWGWRGGCGELISRPPAPLYYCFSTVSSAL